MADETDTPEEPTGRSFSSAEVCEAVGLPRPTFDAWMLRGYMPLPPGPGTGRARRFSLTNAVRLAITAELNRLGIAVSVAAIAASLVPEPFTGGDQRLAVLLSAAPSPGRDEGIPAPRRAIFSFTTFDDVASQIAELDGHAFAFVDVTAVVQRTARALGVELEPGAPGWWSEHVRKALSEGEPPKPRPKFRKAVPPKD